MSQSDLHRHLDSYLCLREALGFQVRTEGNQLRDFVEFVEHTQLCGPIRAQLAIDWACTASPKCGTSGASQRLGVVRGFLIYLRATLPETEVPPHNVIPSARRPKPFIFRADQIHALMRAAQQAGPHGSLRPYTLSTLIGLLASTGLRIGEARQLTVGDVELDRDIPFLHIRQTKYFKARLVPLHASTVDQLRHYQAMRHQLRYDELSEVFFVANKGQVLPKASLRHWFTTVCERLGIKPTHGERRPSLHALRHTFAVERIRRWYEEGADVQALLPHLSVYLGHVCPENTYWYLSATPELLTAASARFQDYAIGGEAS